MNEDRIAGTARNMGGKVQEGFGRVMQELITVPLRNFQVTFLALGVVAAGVSLARTPAAKRNIWEELLAYFVLFGIGFGLLYNARVFRFYMNSETPQALADATGWAPRRSSTAS
jgi:hypothetical protein